VLIYCTRHVSGITFKAKIFESQIILKCLGARKPKGLKRNKKTRRPKQKQENQSYKATISAIKKWLSKRGGLT
jgi:hypothetical protein